MIEEGGKKPTYEKGNYRNEEENVILLESFPKEKKIR